MLSGWLCGGAGLYASLRTPGFRGISAGLGGQRIRLRTPHLRAIHRLENIGAMDSRPNIRDSLEQSKSIAVLLVQCLKATDAKFWRRSYLS